MKCCIEGCDHEASETCEFQFVAGNPENMPKDPFFHVCRCHADDLEPLICHIMSQLPPPKPLPAQNAPTTRRLQ